MLIVDIFLGRARFLPPTSPLTSTTSSLRSSRTRWGPPASSPRRKACQSCQCEFFQPSSSSCNFHSCRIKCKIFKTKEDITIKISDQVNWLKFRNDPTHNWQKSLTVVSGRMILKLSSFDQGGGISRNDKRKVFNYMYSTAPQVPSSSEARLRFIIPASGYWCSWWRVLFRQLGWVHHLHDVD